MSVDEDRVAKPAKHEIGQDLAMLSVAELDERIALLRAEIARIEDVRKQKGSHRSAADAFFKL